MTLKCTILGCGNSSGVPAVGNYWGACDPHDTRNRRTRCSLAVQSETTTIIVDTGPDFREQLNRENIAGPSVSAVLYTHAHSDHVHGIDDLRSIYYQNGRNQIDVYGKGCTLSEISGRFNYLFEGGNDEEYPAVLRAHVIPEDAYGQPFVVGDISVVPIEMDHGTCLASGYRFGDFAYCVDVKRLDHKALDLLAGVKTWVVDGAAYKNPNKIMHAHLQAIYDYNRHIKAEAVYVTSLSAQMNYKTLEAEMPEGVYPAFDGLVLEAFYGS